MSETILHKHLIRVADDGKSGYQYTAPMVELLSKVSGVPKNIIATTKLYPRTPLRYIPFYPAQKGGGAITLGNHKKHSITFTENFFSSSKALFGQAAYANNTRTWLRMSAHEVGHLEHAHRYRSLVVYLVVFTYQYLRYGHDAAPLEQEAERGPQQLRRFRAYLKAQHAPQSLESLMESAMSNEQKIAQISMWWEGYKQKIS